MIEEDTIKLLRECDAGIKMGTSAIEEVMDKIESNSMRECLENCAKKHRELAHEIQKQLDEYHDDGKDPSPVTKGMSRMKTEFKLAVGASDQTIAELMTDGCNMGVKSLSRYLNQYKAADETSKDFAKRLIALESTLAEDLRAYL